jgi:hypothetical protein
MMTDKSLELKHFWKLLPESDVSLGSDDKDDDIVKTSNVKVSKNPPSSRLTNVLACHKNHPVLFALFYSAILTVAVFFLITCAPTCTLGPSYYRPLTLEKKATQFNLIMFGDSLITGNHRQKFNIFPIIASKVASFIPHYNLNMINFGEGENRIIELRNRIEPVLSTPSDAILLLWDSDVSSSDETAENMSYLREVYISNVTYVLDRILQSDSSKLIAITGPIILGERLSACSKSSMLDEYVEINQKICTAYNIAYIDLRKAFLSEIPWYRMVDSGCLTVDGEHENRNGMTIVAKAVAKTVIRWIGTRT